MDDLLMNMLISQMAKEIIAQKLVEELVTQSCDLCSKRFLNNTLIKCAFCEKAFCKNCCGKEGTCICKICNWALANALNYKILEKFGINELKTLCINYKINLRGPLERRDLIEAILKNFKKSIEGSNSSSVNVEQLKMKMLKLKVDEDIERENTIQKETERAKLFTNLDRENIKSETLTINFKDSDHVNVSVKDIPTMSVREIKTILDSFEVDYSFAIEKQELVKLAVNLTEQYNKFRAQNPQVVQQNASEDNQPLNDDKLFECIICMDKRINSVFLNCAHSKCCYECGEKMDKCPVCRANVEKCMKIYFG